MKTLTPLPLSALLLNLFFSATLAAEEANLEEVTPPGEAAEEISTAAAIESTASEDSTPIDEVDTDTTDDSVAPSSDSSAREINGTTSPESSALEEEEEGADDTVDEREWYVSPGVQVFTQYAFLLTDGSTEEAEWYHEFDIPRAWLWLDAGWRGAQARVLLEGVRAGGRGSLFGVGGDSVVVRFREAWAGYRLFNMLDLRLGIIPELTAPMLTEAWGLRAVSQTVLRQFDLLHSADLGGQIRGTLPRGLGTLGIALYNGESYVNPELNRGKNTELFAELHPLAWLPNAEPLTLTIAYQIGSTGTGLARTNRLTGGLFWLGERIAGGAWVVWLQGIEDRGDREGLLVEAFARGRIWRGLVAGAKFSYFLRNLEDSDTANEDWLMEIVGTVGYQILRPLAVFFAVDRRIAGETAQAALPAYESWAFRIVAEFALGSRPSNSSDRGENEGI